MDAGVNKDTPISDASNNYSVTDPLDKLNVIGAHFARVYTQNINLPNESLSRIVSTATNHLKHEMNHKLANNIILTTFTVHNTADNADREIIPENYFTSYTKLSVIFKTLNNNRSFGIDNVPNVALKQISAKMIKNYSILFNNILNDMYFPDSRKSAKVIALKKKGNVICNT